MDSRQRIPSKLVISRVKDLTILKRCEQIVRLEKRTDMTGDADVCGITVIRAESRECSSNSSNNNSNNSNSNSR